MKILYLNIWGGRAGQDKLIQFVESLNDSVDVFCFQEIWSAPYEHCEGTLAGGSEINHENIMVESLQEIAKILPDYEYFFHPHHLDNYGLMMLVRKDLDVKESGDIFVHKERGYVPDGDIGTHARNIQYVTIEHNNSTLTIINFHGLWNGKGKTDSKDRLKQSKNIIHFVKKLTGDTVLGGDFNLLPETESLRLFEIAGMKNLISDYDIKSTRTSFYKKEEKFADYVFVSEGVSVVNFKVLPDEVSDHSPLLLEIK